MVTFRRHRSNSPLWGTGELRTGQGQTDQESAPLAHLTTEADTWNRYRRSSKSPEATGKAGDTGKQSLHCWRPADQHASKAQATLHWRESEHNSQPKVSKCSLAMPSKLFKYKHTSRPPRRNNVNLTPRIRKLSSCLTAFIQQAPSVSISWFKAQGHLVPQMTKSRSLGAKVVLTPDICGQRWETSANISWTASQEQLPSALHQLSVQSADCTSLQNKLILKMCQVHGPQKKHKKMQTPYQSFHPNSTSWHFLSWRNGELCRNKVFHN